MVWRTLDAFTQCPELNLGRLGLITEGQSCRVNNPEAIHSMARAAGKKGTKTAATAISSGSKTKENVTSTGPPSPFNYAPTSLRPFLSTLPTNHIYLVHIDKSAPNLKWRVFLVPLLMNLTIITVLCVRAYFAAPVYLDQIINIFGYNRAPSDGPPSSNLSDVFGVITERTFLLMADYALFGFVGSWPREFFFGGKNSRFVGSWEWRRKLGFKDAEIIVRRGRIWDTLLMPEKDQERTWTVEEELTIKFKIEPAMRPGYISKTGYLLLDKDWDLEFKGMLDAHRLVGSGDIQIDDLRRIALVYYKKQWLVWKCEEAPDTEILDGKHDEVIRNFKDKLIGMGQEDVFYRWIEIVQYETNQPGGFSAARQEEAMRDLKRQLVARGVNYDKFWEEIGGKKGLPGLEEIEL